VGEAFVVNQSIRIKLDVDNRTQRSASSIVFLVSALSMEDGGLRLCLEALMGSVSKLYFH